MNKVIDVFTGFNHTIFLMEDGTLRGCGSNTFCQLTRSENDEHYKFPIKLQKIPSGKKIIKISMGDEFTTVLTEDGVLWGVGKNDYGQLGCSGIKKEFTPIAENVQSVSCGKEHTIILLKNGVVKASGRNNYCQIGQGKASKNVKQYKEFREISGLSNVKDVFAGAFSSFFLLQNGMVMVCGNNVAGCLGIRDEEKISTLTLIKDMHNVKSISSVYHTLFLLEDGSVKSCGSTNYGVQGIPPDFGVWEPTLVSNLENVEKVIASQYNSIFLLKDGTIKICGRNTYGQLGLDEFGISQLKEYFAEKITDYVQSVPNLEKVKSIGSGDDYVVYVLEDGRVKAVGSNLRGEIGLGYTGANSEITFIPELSHFYRYVYIKDGDAYYVDEGGVWNKVEKKYEDLNDEEKRNMFLAARYDIEEYDKLACLERFKIALFEEETDFFTDPQIALLGIPKSKLVFQKALISTKEFYNVREVKLSVYSKGRGGFKVVVTNDLENYKSYDFSLQEWIDVDHSDKMNVLKYGMNAEEIEYIPCEAWGKILKEKNGFAFAYLPVLEEITDTSEIDWLRLIVDMKGRWEKV